MSTEKINYQDMEAMLKSTYTNGSKDKKIELINAGYFDVSELPTLITDKNYQLALANHAIDLNTKYVDELLNSSLPEVRKKTIQTLQSLTVNQVDKQLTEDTDIEVQKNAIKFADKLTEKQIKYILDHEELSNELLDRKDFTTEQKVKALPKLNTEGIQKVIKQLGEEDYIWKKEELEYLTKENFVEEIVKNAKYLPIDYQRQVYEDSLNDKNGILIQLALSERENLPEEISKELFKNENTQIRCNLINKPNFKVDSITEVKAILEGDNNTVKATMLKKIPTMILPYNTETKRYEKITKKEIAAFINHKQEDIREAATYALVRRGATTNEIDEILKGDDEAQKLGMIDAWQEEIINKKDAISDEHIQKLLHDTNANVRSHMLKKIIEVKELSYSPQLTEDQFKELVQDSDSRIRKMIAENYSEVYLIRDCKDTLLHDSDKMVRLAVAEQTMYKRSDMIDFLLQDKDEKVRVATINNMTRDNIESLTPTQVDAIVKDDWYKVQLAYLRKIDSEELNPPSKEQLDTMIGGFVHPVLVEIAKHPEWLTQEQMERLENSTARRTLQESMNNRIKYEKERIPINEKDYWTVEFNETGGLVKDKYDGKIVTPEFIDDIAMMDDEIHETEKGYYKFYFDHVEDGQVTEHVRIDIGDGIDSNQDLYETLLESVEKGIDIVHENIEEKQELNAKEYNEIQVEKDEIQVEKDEIQVEKDEIQVENQQKQEEIRKINAFRDHYGKDIIVGESPEHGGYTARYIMIKNCGSDEIQGVIRYADSNNELEKNLIIDHLVEHGYFPEKDLTNYNDSNEKVLKDYNEKDLEKLINSKIQLKNDDTITIERIDQDKDEIVYREKGKDAGERLVYPKGRLYKVKAADLKTEIKDEMKKIEKKQTMEFGVFRREMKEKVVKYTPEYDDPVILDKPSEFEEVKKSIEKSDMNKTRKIIVNHILEELEKGEIPKWNNPTIPQHVHNPISGNRYSGENEMALIAISLEKGYKDPRWVTFNQARSAGITITKGSKGVPLTYYRPKTEEEIEKEKEALQKRLEEGEDIPKEKRHISKFIVNQFTVFNAEQCKDFPPLQLRDMEKEKVVRHQAIEDIIKNSQAKIIEGPTKEAVLLGLNNYYNPKTDEIHVAYQNQFKNQDEYYATVIHEIAHSTGHEKRLNRGFKGNTFDSKKYAKEELVAEFTVGLLSKELDLGASQQTEENMIAYIDSWKNIIKDNPKVIFEAIKDANEATNYIMDHMLSKELSENLKTEYKDKELEKMIQNKAKTKNQNQDQEQTKNEKTEKKQVTITKKGFSR